MGRVIDAALAKGANEISSLQFFSSKADSARSVALAAAVADAKAQAEVMARAAGGSLGQLLELNTSSVPIRPMPLDAADDDARGEPDADHTWRADRQRNRHGALGVRLRTLTLGRVRTDR